MIDHEAQKAQWDQEHRQPFVLKQMDARKASSSVRTFFDFLRTNHLPHTCGIEMGCGKGRNCIGLAAERDVQRMTGFDFSRVAIEVAKERATEAGVTAKTTFLEMDATLHWKLNDSSFDFGIDCTASTDIEDAKGRAFAVSEMRRVLKPRGHLLVYVMSTEDEYQKEMIAKNPAEERNAFYHPATGKFEKAFDEGELAEMYRDFTLVESRRIEKSTTFFGKEYACKLFWNVYRK